MKTIAILFLLLCTLVLMVSAKQHQTDAPTTAPTTTTRHSKTTTTTVAPTKKATTTRAAKTTTTTTTTTKAPKTTTTTTIKAAPTKAVTVSTTQASANSGCSSDVKMMVPLYAYPGSQWDTVAASGSVVHTVAIINPNSGPGNGPDSSYNTYMAKLNAAGVEMIGYVHTSYGARSIADVKADIDIWASQFPYVVGIFLDEASASAAQIPYYTQLYNYIMSMPGWKYDVINPGTAADVGYNSIATQIISYESAASGFSASSKPSGASCNNKDLYSVISYSASSATTMQTLVDNAVSKGYYGWVYATSGTLTGNTYGTLPSYYAQMATYIASKN